MNEAQIVGRYKQLPLGRRTVEWEWIGDPSAPVWISRSLLEDPGFSLNALPWPLVEVDRAPWRDEVLCARADGRNRTRAWLTVARYWLVRKVDPVYRRLILTAMVWGLAHVPMAEIPSWRHPGKKPQ